MKKYICKACNYMWNALISCNDGFRPFSFYIEVIE